MGSDIREGKSTLLILRALQIADERQRRQIQATLGDPAATEKAIREVTRVLRQLGVIEYAQDMSRGYIDEALDCLGLLPESRYKSLLESYARYLVSREL